MFKRGSKNTPQEEIPYAVYETLQSGPSRQYRRLIALCIVGALSLIVILGSVLIVKELTHHQNTPKTHPGSQISTSPNTASNGQQAAQPASTSLSTSTSNAAIPVPKN